MTAMSKHTDQELLTVNPLVCADWDERVLAMPGHTFFHSRPWAETLREAYGYEPVYFTARQGDRFSCLVPAMGVSSFLTGRRGVSLPFSDYCRPLLGAAAELEGVLRSIFEYGRRAGWNYFEIRDGDLPPERLPISWYYAHSLDLTLGESRLFNALQSSTKRNIRKASRENLQISMDNSLEGVRKYFALHCLMRKRHGLPPQPFYFFRSIHKNIISRGSGFVMLAYSGGKPISGALYIHFGSRAVYKYGASDFAFQNLRGNDLVMWEAIRWFAREGFEDFCFGRTDPDNAGLRRFKSGWGTKERVIRYYRYNLKKDEFVGNNPGVNELGKKIATRMPVALLNLIGRVIYRHMA